MRSNTMLSSHSIAHSVSGRCHMVIAPSILIIAPNQQAGDGIEQLTGAYGPGSDSAFILAPSSRSCKKGTLEKLPKIPKAICFQTESRFDLVVRLAVNIESEEGLSV